MVAFRLIFWMMVLMASTGCGEVVAVHLYPFPMCGFAVGDSAYVSASADRANFPVQAYSSIMRPEKFLWATSAPNVMTVSRRGIVHGISVGTATITASAEGFTGSADFRVVKIGLTVAISPSPAILNVRDTILLTANARDSAGASITLERRETLFSLLGDVGVAEIVEHLPAGVRLAGFETGTRLVSWSVRQRCGVHKVDVR